MKYLDDHGIAGRVGTINSLNNKSMNNLELALRWLDGKKTIILSIAGLVLGYLITANYIDPKLGGLILSILNIIAGGAVYATDKVLGSRTEISRSK